MNSLTVNPKVLSVAAAVFAGALALSACSPANEKESTQAPTTEAHTMQSQPAEAMEHDHATMTSQAGQEHSGHDHPEDGGPAPEGMVMAENPAYPAGMKVQLDADHMPGMKGSPATIVGAYKTYTYAIDYTPVGGGEPVKNHKWVVQEEIEDAGSQRIPDGTVVTVLADHMKGMQGAKATVVSSTEETVYQVDVQADGMTMKNHKWVTESEIKPAQ
ncbi:YdhK family protein [Corynebacterium aquatimens]|uniref:DUF1541 domain-containing protein n=1 Tax=Corynebacterium aquatimens TaxID=1190508 RepID=A0A931E3R7_9CORY|nr:YdhK family protein [Corynebacterium aquatimens]MBG6121953.1 hypothetical protein [Corynebacterium aquatimens]WJY65509.1 hypothetical protein CAQUA_03980 [Corynebacterium aquatimens]